MTIHPLVNVSREQYLISQSRHIIQAAKFYQESVSTAAITSHLHALEMVSNLSALHKDALVGWKKINNSGRIKIHQNALSALHQIRLYHLDALASLTL